MLVKKKKLQVEVDNDLMDKAARVLASEGVKLTFFIRKCLVDLVENGWNPVQKMNNKEGKYSGIEGEILLKPQVDNVCSDQMDNENTYFEEEEITKSFSIPVFSESSRCIIESDENSVKQNVQEDEINKNGVIKKPGKVLNFYKKIYKIENFYSDKKSLDAINEAMQKGISYDDMCKAIRGFSVSASVKRKYENQVMGLKFILNDQYISTYIKEYGFYESKSETFADSQNKNKAMYKCEHNDYLDSDEIDDSICSKELSKNDVFMLGLHDSDQSFKVCYIHYLRHQKEGSVDNLKYVEMRKNAKIKK